MAKDSPKDLIRRFNILTKLSKGSIYINSPGGMSWNMDLQWLLDKKYITRSRNPHSKADITSSGLSMLATMPVPKITPVVTRYTPSGPKWNYGASERAELSRIAVRLSKIRYQTIAEDSGWLFDDAPHRLRMLLTCHKNFGEFEVLSASMPAKHFKPHRLVDSAIDDKRDILYKEFIHYNGTVSLIYEHITQMVKVDEWQNKVETVKERITLRCDDDFLPMILMLAL